MKTSFSFKRWRRWILLAVVCALAYLLLRLPERVRRSLENNLTPPLATALIAPSRSANFAREAILDVARGYWAEEENRKLRGQMVLLKLELAQAQEKLKAMEEKAPRLSASLGPLTRLVIPASLLARDPSAWFNYVTLDKGRNQGVAQEAGVISEAGVVGKVASVTATTCKVVFLIDPSCRIAVRDARSKVAATLTGSGRRSCQLLYLSGQDDIKVGDLIETGAEGVIFPKGVPAGEVVKVEKRDNGLTLYAEVKPFVRLALLESFYIMGARP
jgi:rod shape-determining protein MreC